MQEEVDQKTIALAIKTGKLTGQVLQAAMKKYLEARKKGKARLPHGQQSLRKLKRDGSAPVSYTQLDVYKRQLQMSCTCMEVSRRSWAALRRHTRRL